MVRIFRVKGDSLFPLLKHKVWLFCVDARLFFKLHKGDLVVFKKAPYGWMVKQIDRIEGDKIYVSGIDPMSVGSDVFGALKVKEIRYKVLRFTKGDMITPPRWAQRKAR